MHEKADVMYIIIRQQLLIKPTITNLNKLQFIQLQMFCDLVGKQAVHFN